jgi:hypothetical protein
MMVDELDLIFGFVKNADRRTRKYHTMAEIYVENRAYKAPVPSRQRRFLTLTTSKPSSARKATFGLSAFRLT